MKKLLVATVLLLSAAPSARTQSTGPASVLTIWFHHIERNELDSLRPLLTDDFRFVADGTRMGPDAFVVMIKSLGIHDPRVKIGNVETHVRGDVAYLVYDRDETVRAKGSSRTFPETGALVLVRARDTWRMAQWAATSPR